MKLGRLNVVFNARHVLHSGLNLCLVTLIAIYAGGSVPDELRRYIVTQQDTTNVRLEAAVDKHAPDEWQSVGAYVVGKDMLAAMNGPERAAIRVAYQKEINEANAEENIRQRIRMPLLPGPVTMDNAGPAERLPSPSPLTEAKAPVAAKPTPVASAAPSAAPATPLDEDLATIEALKAALQDLRKEGLAVGNYRNDIADK